MANVTRDLYPNAEENDYQKVVFQRGRDVADAELNVLQDILRGNRAYQARASKEEGVYGASDLLSVASGASNDLTIKAGSYFIEGMRYVLAADTLLSVLTADSISTPGGAQIDAVAIDFSETEVDAATDTDILYSGLGETTRRRKLTATWRYLADVDTYQDPYAALDPAVFAGNTRRVFIAFIERTAVAAIEPEDVVDVRPRPITNQIQVDLDIAMLGSCSVATRTPTGWAGTYKKPLFIKKSKLWVTPGIEGGAGTVAGTTTGDQWALLFTSTDATSEFNLIAANDDESLIVTCGSTGNMAVSTDYGYTWVDVVTSGVMATMLPYAILYDEVNAVWVIGGLGSGTDRVITSTDPAVGSSWTVRYSSANNPRCATKTNTGVLMGMDSGEALYATDPEGTWTLGGYIKSVGFDVNQLAYDAATSTTRAAVKDVGTNLTSIHESVDDGVTWYTVLEFPLDQIYVTSGGAQGTDGFVSPTAGGEASFFYMPGSRLWILTGLLDRIAAGNTGPCLVAIAGTSYTYIPVPGAGGELSLRLGFDPDYGIVGTTETTVIRANPRRVPPRL